MNRNKVFEQPVGCENKPSGKVIRKNWEIAACALLFGVAMIIIGVFL
ncbi:MAG: hypothetical protein J6O50_12590 [Ruminiclostridium sp.]|nr:hypothetical protein [Ruminiclostridium sp.]